MLTADQLAGLLEHQGDTGIRQEIEGVANGRVNGDIFELRLVGRHPAPACTGSASCWSGSESSSLTRYAGTWPSSVSSWHRGPGTCLGFWRACRRIGACRSWRVKSLIAR